MERYPSCRGWETARKTKRRILTGAVDVVAEGRRDRAIDIALVMEVAVAVAVAAFY